MKNNKISNSGNSGRIHFDDTDELLDIRYDNIFKAVFTKDTPASKGALSGLISALIRRRVIVQTITANEPPPNSVFDRRIRFDIACKAESGELINIEMSFNPNPYEPVRLEYYASRQFSGQCIQGVDKDYTDLVETFQIAIIAKERFFPDEVLVHTFEYHDPVHTVSLGGKSRIITVELPKAERIIDKPTGEMDSSERWSVFFEYLTNKSKRVKMNEILEREEEIAMAGEALIHISRDEIEQARLTTELKNILDYQSGMVSAERKGIAKGLRKGLTKGREEGLTEGIVKGRTEGLEKGLTEGKLEVARKMKHAGRPIAEIEEFTGLSSAAIKQIK